MANRILLADDSITIQKVVNLTFTDEGIDVVTVGNGELAVKKLRDEVFDLVLADIFMPGRNGYEVCEYVKSDPGLAKVPVILLVGAFEPFDRSEASRVRADGHLTKPFESRVLVETVRRLLASAPARPSAEVAEAPAPAMVDDWNSEPAMPFPIVADKPDSLAYIPFSSTPKLPSLGEAEAGQQGYTASIGSPLDESESASAPPLFHFDVNPSLGAESEAQPEPESPAPFADLPPEEFRLARGTRALGAQPGAASTGADDAEGAPSGFSYQSVPPSETPLDLDDYGAIDQHTYYTPDVTEERDPLLETFAEMSESAFRADAPPDPDLEVNARTEGRPSMTVGAVDDIISAWDPLAQPLVDKDAVVDPPYGETRAECVSEVEVDPNETPAHAYYLPLPETLEPGEEAAGLGLSADVVDEADFEMPSAEQPLDFPYETDGQASLAPPEPDLFEGQGFATEEASFADIDLAEREDAGGGFAIVETSFAGGPTTGSSREGDSSTHETAAPGAGSIAEQDSRSAVPAGEVAHATDGPVSHRERTAFPANGSNGSAPVGITPGVIPSDVIEEVVRRTVERMSDDVIREIAWEVVPDLAERLIRKHLGENR